MADEDRKATVFIPYLSRPGFKFLSWLLQCFGHIQSKNEVTLLEVSIFQKSAKTEVKTFQPTEIEKRPFLYLVLAAKASNFYHGFYNTLDIFSPKIKMLSQQ